MNFACLSFLLVCFSLDTAGKCDTYFVGTVWIHRDGHAVDSETAPVSYQGCKKGCFYNETFNEDGARVCEKCSVITDENICKGHEATCSWTKSGKCTSASCPQIAKNRNTIATPSNAGFIDDNTAIRTANYQLQLRLQKECIEGSNLEKYYNQIYLDHYKKWVNYQYRSQAASRPPSYEGEIKEPINNCDNCTVNPPNSHKCTQNECDNFNASLLLDAHPRGCDDRLYRNLANTTKDPTCRQLPDTSKEICLFNIDKLQDNLQVYQDTTNSSYRPGTQYEYCLQNLTAQRDPECIKDANGTACLLDAYNRADYPPLTPENRRRIYGYSTVVEICDHIRSISYKNCEDAYEADIKSCDNTNTYRINPDGLIRQRIDVKASRAACHNLYHCMYSKINGRCSYWSIWAFILVLVVVTLVVVGAGVGAVVFLFLGKK